MVPSLLALVLSAQPVVAVVGLTPLDVTEQRADYLTEQLGAELLRQGLVVTTPADLRAVLGLERQRQLLGCEGSSCLAELTGALGAEFVVLGQVARSSVGYRLTVKGVRASTGVAMFVWSTEQPTEPRLVSELSRCAAAFVDTLGLGSRSSGLAGPLVLGGTGGVIALVGAGFLVSAGIAWADLRRRGADAVAPDRAAIAAREGASHQVIGLIAAGVGVAVGAAGLLWGLSSGSAKQQTTLFFTPELIGVQVLW